MKQILFMGDSLTAGNLGSSYLELLQNHPEMKQTTLINEGEDGYTIEGIRLKMEALLDAGTHPDILVLEGGANDLLLPHMQAAGSEWDPFIRKLKRHGSVPLISVETFREGMRTMIGSALDRGISKVLTCTIPCLGENLNSPLNRKRNVYNRIIRDVTAEFQTAFDNCGCVDLAAEFERLLAPDQPGPDYLFRTPGDLPADSVRIKQEGQQKICSERNLHLTIDGAHLNRKGAEAVAEVFLKSLIAGRT